MIGQLKLLSTLSNLIVENKFPTFSILAGTKGSGKELMAKEIAKKLQATFIFSGIKVDEVRDLIELAYSQVEPFVYYIDKSDQMSVQAKNAILKVVEEPPKNAYFIMATEDLENVLATLKSRGSAFQLDPYSPGELMEYINSKNHQITERELQIVLNVCDTPGEVDELIKCSVLKFYDFVTTVLLNLGIVSGVNAFKISNSMKFKEDSEGWDIQLFIKLAQFRALELAKEQPSTAKKYCKFNVTAAKLKETLKYSNSNKFMTFDTWLLGAKEALT